MRSTGRHPEIYGGDSSFLGSYGKRGRPKRVRVERERKFALVLSKRAGALKTLSLESFFELLREKEKELPSIVLLN
jgi:hypothetical protein